MPKRLLLVDDEPRNLAVLEGHLRPLGYELMRAENGRKALALYAEHAPDLVLLDVVMPGFDGLDVLAHIRAQRDRSYVPVVLVTAHSEREHRVRGLEAGADDFLEKPIDGSILLARVKTLLALKESRDAVAERHAVLERLQRDQRELMQFIVHDLKNPLAAIWMNATWLKDSVEGGSDVEGALSDTLEAAGRLRGMIDDLLIVYQLEESAFPVHEESISVASVLRPLIASYTRKAEAKAVSLAPPPMIDAEVRADRQLLRRVLENILDNCLRYTPASGRVEVAARSEGQIEIAVSNSGPPIPLAERGRIFQKFARGKGSEPSRGSAGLGLYFCKRAIEAQGGEIGVFETKEWPTSFVIRLPHAS
jgi:signal transduction histidine kinase